jgi:hypothetical protein
MKWKGWSPLSDETAKQREAAFEAAVLAELAAEKRKQAAPCPAVAPHAPDQITITVTAAGKSATYASLDAVPLDIRERIVSAWLGMGKKS